MFPKTLTSLPFRFAKKRKHYWGGGGGGGGGGFTDSFITLDMKK